MSEPRLTAAQVRVLEQLVGGRWDTQIYAGRVELVNLIYGGYIGVAITDLGRAALAKAKEPTDE